MASRFDSGNPFGASPDQAVSVWIDSRGRIARHPGAGRVVRSPVGGMEAVAGRLLPVDEGRRDAWLAFLAATTRSQRGSYFQVTAGWRPPPVAVLPDPAGSGLRVVIPGASICSVETVRAFAAMAGWSARECEVVVMLTKGHAPGDIAGIFGTSTATVRTQIKIALRKSPVGGTGELLSLLARLPDLGAATASAIGAARPFGAGRQRAMRQTSPGISLPG